MSDYILVELFRGKITTVLNLIVVEWLNVHSELAEGFETHAVTGDLM